MTAQHGILKPNPVLFDLEKRKKKPLLAHELGAGNHSIKSNLFEYEMGLNIKLYTSKKKT